MSDAEREFMDANEYNNKFEPLMGDEFKAESVSPAPPMAATCAELHSENVSLREELDTDRARTVKLIVDSAIEIDTLRTQVADMRKALQTILEHDGREGSKDYDAIKLWDARDAAKKLLEVKP